MTRIELTHKMDIGYSVAIYADRAERFTLYTKGPSKSGIRLYREMVVVAAVFMDHFNPSPELDKLIGEQAKSNAIGDFR